MTFEENRYTNESKFIINESDFAEAEKAFDTICDEFLYPDHIPQNVIGLGIGAKRKNGEPTGEAALMVFVTQMPEKDTTIPAKLANFPTEIVEVGVVQAAARTSLPPVRQAGTTSGRMLNVPLPGFEPGFDSPEMLLEQAYGVQPYTAGELELEQRRLLNRIRPVQGGFSVGYKRGAVATCGTIGTCVYDMLTGSDTHPPRQGVGKPQGYYILGTNHVLANCNEAMQGDTILQPSLLDGGQDPADRVARLARFVPIDFEPFKPRERHNNLVDAAIAEGDFRLLDRQIFWAGNVRGWRRRTMTKLGMLVQKTGRTTRFTTGRIVALKATIDVTYGAGKIARFRDQIITTPMAAGGDSGALLTTPDNVAVGMLFAASPAISVHNHIEHVRSLLRVEVAEQAL